MDPYKQAKEQLQRSQNISDYTDIPSKLSEADINQKTISHPHFQNYDHSLDIKRDIGLKHGKPVYNEEGEIECGDGLVMGNLTSQDILDQMNQ